MILEKNNLNKRASVSKSSPKSRADSNGKDFIATLIAVISSLYLISFDELSSIKELSPSPINNQPSNTSPKAPWPIILAIIEK